MCWCPGKPVEGFGAKVTGICESPDVAGSWVPNFGPLQELLSHLSSLKNNCFKKKENLHILLMTKSYKLKNHARKISMKITITYQALPVC